MKTFTIDTDNNISAFATAEEAAATNPSQSFTSQQELVELAAGWPAERLVAIWNSLPGVTAVKRFKNSNARRQPHLGADSGLGRAGAANRAARKAEGGPKGQGWRPGAQGCARQGQSEQEGQPRQESAQSQESRQGA